MYEAGIDCSTTEKRLLHQMKGFRHQLECIDALYFERQFPVYLMIFILMNRSYLLPLHLLKFQLTTRNGRDNVLFCSFCVAITNVSKCAKVLHVRKSHCLLSKVEMFANRVGNSSLTQLLGKMDTYLLIKWIQI